jgi:signal transduction histidine kinase
MLAQRLLWRIGLPYAAFVLAGSFMLLAWMAWNLTLEERAHLETIAKTNAAFINRARLPTSVRMADDLTEVLGVSVFFRDPKSGRFTPELPLAGLSLVAKIPSDGLYHRQGSVEGVAIPLHSGHDLLVARTAFAAWREVWLPRTFVVLGIFWALSLVVAWVVSRSLVFPLRHLAARLPDIEKPAPLHLPEAEREDEIGDVARAITRTHEALQMERTERERAEKLAVLGRMTAALAHEIQNPVAAIKMHAQLAATQDGDQASAHVIAGEAARIEGLVNQWMFLTKPEPPSVAELNVADLLREVMTVYRAQAEHAAVTIELDAEESLSIRADRRRLAQVFSNIIINAVQAMPRGGLLRIKVRRGAADVRIDFADSGSGFTPEALRRVPEMFYSGKEGGMGIGLSVAAEIIKAHGGSLQISNRPEGGASITITLPPWPGSDASPPNFHH